MEHFVVVNDWSNEYESGNAVLGVGHSMDEAIEIFNASVAEEKRYAEEHGFTVYTDCEAEFDAGEDGYYVTNHTHLYIQIVK